MSEFRLGVNYWPARSAVYWWDELRPADLDADLARLADWGFREARIFLIWEAFQPRPDTVADAALGKLEQVLAIGQRRGVGLVLSLFCGHMSVSHGAGGLGSPTPARSGRRLTLAPSHGADCDPC